MKHQSTKEEQAGTPPPPDPVVHNGVLHNASLQCKTLVLRPDTLSGLAGWEKAWKQGPQALKEGGCTLVHFS